MNTRKLLESEVAAYKRIREQELEQQLNDLNKKKVSYKVKYDSVKFSKSDPSETNLTESKLQEKMKTNHNDILKITAELKKLPQEVKKETSDEKNYERIRTVIRKGTTKVKENLDELKSPSTPLSPEQKDFERNKSRIKLQEEIVKLKDSVYSAVNEISIWDNVRELLDRVERQNRESKSKKSFRTTKEKGGHLLRTFFTTPYENKSPQDLPPTTYPKKQALEIERFLDKLLEVHQGHKDSNKTIQDTFDEAVSIRAVEYNSNHKESYSSEKYKHEFLSTNEIGLIKHTIEGPDSESLYELELQLTHINEKLKKKTHLRGGYSDDVAPRKIDEYLFLKQIKEMYLTNIKDEKKLTLNDCKIAVSAALSHTFQKESSKLTQNEKIQEAKKRIDDIYKSSSTHAWLEKVSKTSSGTGLEQLHKDLLSAGKSPLSGDLSSQSFSSPNTESKSTSSLPTSQITSPTTSLSSPNSTSSPEGFTPKKNRNR